MFLTCRVVVRGIAAVFLLPKNLDAATDQTNRKIIFCDVLEHTDSPLAAVIISLLVTTRESSEHITLE